MTPARLITALFLFLVTEPAFAQKKVLIQAIEIQNDYEEVAANPFRQPATEAAFLQVLEQKLGERLGPISVTYLTEKKIILLDRAVASEDPAAAWGTYQDLYRAKKNINWEAYDVLVNVRVELRDVFKGKQDNLQIVSTVTAFDPAKQKLFKDKGRVNVTIAPVPFTLAQLNEQGAQVYEGFPLGEEKLADALTGSLAQALDQRKETREMQVQRQPVNPYADFIREAETYKIVAPNDYGEWVSKTRLLQFLTYTKHRPILVSRQSDHRDIRLSFRERRITDISYQTGLPQVFQVAKERKNYLLSSQFPADRKEQYNLHAVLTNKKALGGITWSEPLYFKLTNRSKTTAGEFAFTATTDSSFLNRRYARMLGRIYTPWAALEGKLEDLPFIMRPNPYTLNAVEMEWGGKQVGLVVHAAAPRPYLRKRKNKLPYFVYFHPGLSEQQQQLLLQTFQTYHIAQALKDGQEMAANREK